MGPSDKARNVSKLLCSLVFSVGMVAILPGTAVAFIPADTGTEDFCSPASYDNNDPQVTGHFTDRRNGAGISSSGASPNCVLNLNGGAGSAGDMWITTLHWPGNPGTDPTFSCVEVTAEVLIKTFNNRKGVGLVTHYDPSTGKGLFLGLYNNGNNDGLTLSTFEGGTLTGTISHSFLGSKIQENVWYRVDIDVCHAAGVLNADVTLECTVCPDPPLPDSPNIVEVENISVPWPAGIATSGQIGIAGWARYSVLGAAVRRFFWGPFDD